MRINIADTLRDYNIEYKKDGNVAILLCPFHEDSHPSGRLDLETGKYTCFACPDRKFTNFYSYLAKRLNLDIRTVFATLAKSYYLEKDNPVAPSDVQTWHAALFGNNNLLSELSHRCVTEDLIRKYRLGFGFESRVTIPVYNDIGVYVNIRCYAPGALKDKFINLKGRNRKKIRLYPIDQLAYDTVLLCGGEIKAIVAAAQLNKYGIGAISPTCGENVWDIKLNGYFADKVVYVNCDVDKTGEDAAEKRCRLLKGSVRELYKLVLPLDKIQYPKGDINDFVRIGGDLKAEIDKCEPWKLILDSSDILDETEEPVEVDLDAAVSASMAKKRISFKAVVSSKDTSPFPIPENISCVCTRDQEAKCKICPIYINFASSPAQVELKRERIEIIEMIGQELSKQNNILKKAFGIPLNCTAIKFVPTTFHHVEDVRISQQLDITSRLNERSMQIAYCVGTEAVNLNETYHMVGRMYPHPTNQQASLLISKYEPTQDTLASYVPSDLDKLLIFQPEHWDVDSIRAKLNNIYTDLEANVTRIFERRQFHLAVDLAYHSPLFIDFDGKKSVKGWVEVLVIGDSAQGKSEVIDNIVRHYQLGEKVVCKGATPAGLLGGVQQYGKRWFASWGKIPTHDRRLVILEELKGAKVEVIAALTDMRSSGIAALTKIEKRITNARTRLIAISNPRSDMPVSSYNYGIDTVKELIGNPEDVRRFDLALVLNKNAVNIDELQKRRPTVEHKYTSELSRELILFAWTVPSVKFEDEMYLLDCASSIAHTYTDEIPLVDKGSMRLKLARLSAALAARTFSISDEDTVFVRRCHIDFIMQYINKIYEGEEMGYKDYSTVVMGAEKLIDPIAVESKLLNGTPYPKELISHMITTEEIDMQFIQDTLGWQANDARDLLSFFVRHHALKRKDRNYRKTVEFTDLLKKLENNIGTRGRPVYIKEDF